jgi:hypothetical protein
MRQQSTPSGTEGAAVSDGALFIRGETYLFKLTP